MIRKQGRYPTPPRTVSELHRAWLELVETDGPFLAIPPLKRVWTQGMPALPDDQRNLLRDAKNEFDAAWETLDIDPDSGDALSAYRIARDAWVQVVLRDVAGWSDTLLWQTDDIATVSATSPNRHLSVRPTAGLKGSDGLGALVLVTDRCESLHETGRDGWAATPVDRMEALLRSSGVAIGIVTDGRWWGLVCAREKAMVASGIVDAQTWIEEPLTRNAFFTLIARQYIIGGDANERLPQLFAESVAAAEEITEALGSQVRTAVEWLIQAFAETSAETRRRGQNSALPANPHETYHAAVTIMMRVVFLLFAEQRGLLPQSDLFEQGYGISGELDALERRRIDEGEESLDSTYLTWHRLLATSQALYRGASFENIRMPAYGGSLFDPARFPFLSAPNDNGTLALPISDRVMLHVMRSVQIAQLRGGDARRISFRDIDVEQIGYIYEGLLGYTCMSVISEAQIGLVGARGAEPEVPLTVLEKLSSEHRTSNALAAAIISWVKEEQPGANPPSVNALAKLLAATPSKDADRQLRAITTDESLRARLHRFSEVIRRDFRDRPIVVLEGGLLVTETPSRRNAGAHYTPKDLAEEVVQHAIEPLCYLPGPHQTPERTAWRLRSPDEILGLKIADIAVGSGAFLVAAARYLAARLVEAWVDEDRNNAYRRDLHQHAIRQVVATCLYGADINEMAVEMCKLSLWLVSLDRNLPFSFVDDKILLGNSLLGITNLNQLRDLHIDPPQNHQRRLSNLDMDGVVQRAIEMRQRLATEVEESDPQRSATAKSRQLVRLNELTARLRAVADGIVAAGLPLGGKPGKPLNDAYESLAEAVSAAFPSTASKPDPANLSSIVDAGLTPTVPTDYARWRPLHWVLEVPDVLVTHGGFDAVIGNPPFLTAKKITGAIGTEIRDWFVHQLAGSARGNADLVAYFLLRAFKVLRPTGTLGIIATNTVAQGGSREVGLDQVVSQGLTLTRAIQSAAWPSASANIEYSVIWGSRGAVSDTAHRIADGVVVPRISTLLEPAGAFDGPPQRLKENDGIAFIGCYVLGLGFVLRPEEAFVWISDDDRNREVIFPYLNGEDLNTSPDCTASRWVIDFNDRSMSEAATYARPFGRIQELVQPERAKNNRKLYRERWWQFGENCPGMRRAIDGLDEVLVMARISKTVMPARVPNQSVFNEKTCVFATGSYADQAVLSSIVHQAWAVKYSTTMRTDVSYTPSEVFACLPRPYPTESLKGAGRTLDVERREIMLRRQLGLTRLYNMVNSPDIANSDDRDVARIRQIHVELDVSAMEAYGWSDISLEHGFHLYRQAQRWTVSPAARVTILDRLLEENLRRASAQPRAAKATRSRPNMKASVDYAQETLL